MVRQLTGDGLAATVPVKSSSALIGRLKKRPEFLRVAASRKKWVATGLILQVRRRADTETSDTGVRVGFTVSRKVGNAVRRNRVRRRLRAVAGQVMPGHARAGRDFVIIGRAGTFRRPFAALLNDLRTALKKMDAYRNTEDQ